MRFAHLLVVVAAAGAPAYAQSNCYAPSAELPCDYSQACQVCGKAPCCCRPRQEAQAFAAPPGAFAAPPAVGDVAGESNALGLRGLSVRFPEVSFELPSIRLPSLFHVRRDAEFVSDTSHAPFVAGPAAIYGQISPGGSVFTSNQLAAMQMYAQQQGADCGRAGAAAQSGTAAELDLLRNQLDEERARNRRLEEKMDKLMDCIDDLQTNNGTRSKRHVSHNHHRHQPGDVQHAAYEDDSTMSHPERHAKAGTMRGEHQHRTSQPAPESDNVQRSSTREFLSNLRPSFDWRADK